MATTELVPTQHRTPTQHRAPAVTVTWRLAAGVSSALHAHAEWRGMGARRSLALEALLADFATRGDRARR